MIIKIIEEIILSYDIVINLLSDDKNIALNAYASLINDAQLQYDKLIIDQKTLKPAKVHFYTDDLKKIQSYLKKYVWKIECKEIFYKMKSPVFVQYSDTLFDGGAYWEEIMKIWKDNNRKNIYYVTDISFNKLNVNLLKYWYNDLFDLNTYINIENFLWSIKQEPISNPDNNTKILAHGFDLKTSFRKM